MSLIPRCQDLASPPTLDAYDDMIAPSGLTNGWLTVQADHDVLAVRSVMAPPLGQADCLTGQLRVNGRLARSYGQPVEHSWRPDRITRRTRIAGWLIETVTVVVPGQRVVLVQVKLTNEGAAENAVELSAIADSAITEQAPGQADPPGGDLPGDSLNRFEAAPQPPAWMRPMPPSAPNRRWPVGGLLAGGDGTAVAIQGFAGGTVTSADHGIISTSLNVPVGETGETAYVVAIGRAGEAADVADVAEAALARPAETVGQAERWWDARLADLFTPSRGGAGFSGALPVLETTNEDLKRLYWWGAATLAYFRRDNPDSALGPTYDTLMPRYWPGVTFVWDYALSSFAHALLDPAVMRRQLSWWADIGIHSHYGTQWLNGQPTGCWYSANDYSMTRLVFDYTRVTGDTSFLLEPAGQGERRQPLIDHVLDWATAWEGLRRESALADYGGIDNLLECVSTYTHEVAALNAANVWSMRRAADLCDLVDQSADADRLRRTASDLVPAVLTLYRPGDGFFNARQPGGAVTPVRHCYDYSTVGSTIAEELSAAQRSEMVAFFQRELQTPSWMHALSPWDLDAGYSLRPDHQWNGAYPAWPAEAARATCALGRADIVADWLAGLARTSQQGPCGQAYFTEDAAPTIAGGARKCPSQPPYLTDWACSSSGAWIQLVVETLFGVAFGPDGTVSAQPVMAAIDPTAKLHGLQTRQGSVDIWADGRMIAS